MVLATAGAAQPTYAGAHVDELRTSFGQATASVSAAPSGGGHAGHDMASTTGGGADHGADLDKVLTAARAEGLGDPVEIVPPADANSAYVVRQVQRSRPERQDAVASTRPPAR